MDSKETPDVCPFCHADSSVYCAHFLGWTDEQRKTYASWETGEDEDIEAGDCFVMVDENSRRVIEEYSCRVYRDIRSTSVDKP